LQHEALVDDAGFFAPIVRGVPRFVTDHNYSDNFGFQWNRFAKTQLDRERDGVGLSASRFFTSTRWSPESLADLDVLEVGSGAGRFSRVVLEKTSATLYSIDYSDAVTANFANNALLAPDRFRLFQASVYDLPFPDASFDRVFCFGVLQHTPDVAATLRVLVEKTKVGGELAVDFYPLRGWWTKLHAKYLLRPYTTRMSHERLLALIERHVDRLVAVRRGFDRLGLRVLSRFVPVCDVDSPVLATLTPEQFREWVILDTFDQYAPAHDQPQRIDDVALMIEQAGAHVTFAGYEWFDGMHAAVVRARRDAA
jgi:SAM-dependent methyltransferase